MIKKVGDKWQVLSEAGKVLGEHDSEEKAKAQLGAVEASKARAKKMEEAFGVQVDFETDLQTIEGVDIFAVGTWRGVGSPPEGDKYEAQDLEAMVEAFNAGAWKPHLKITHGSDSEQVNIGQATNLRFEGGKLLADFAKVPKALYELMKKGLFKARSAEVLWNFRDKAGKVWPRVVKAVALLAPGQKPAVSAISEGYQFEALYCYAIADKESDLDDSFPINIITVQPDIGGDPMDEKTKALMKKYECETIEELDAKLTELNQEADEREKKLKKYEEERISVLAETRRQFIDGLKKEGKLLPRHEKVIEKMMEIADGLNERKYSYELGEGEQKGTLSEMMKAYLADMLKLVEFEELSLKSKDKETSGRSAQLEVERLAQKYKEEGKAETRQAAYELVKSEHPKIWKSYMDGKALEEE